MYLDLPLEQMAKRRGAAFQFAFATEAKALLPSAAGSRQPLRHRHA